MDLILLGIYLLNLFKSFQRQIIPQPFLQLFEHLHRGAFIVIRVLRVNIGVIDLIEPKPNDLVLIIRIRVHRL